MQWATDGERWRAWLVDSNVHVLIWLTAALVMGILALNAWLIGQAIVAAYSFPSRNNKSTQHPIPHARRLESFQRTATSP